MLVYEPNGICQGDSALIMSCANCLSSFAANRFYASLNLGCLSNGWDSSSLQFYDLIQLGLVIGIDEQPIMQCCCLVAFPELDIA